MIKECEYCKKRFNARRNSIRFCSNKCVWKKRVLILKGKRFGKWLVLNNPPKTTKKGYSWKCKCDCGKIKFVNSWELRKGTTTSCGCSFRLPQGESAFNRVFKSYIKQAKSRGFCFNLSKEEFRHLTNQNCFYCGGGLTNCYDEQKIKRNGKIYYHNANGNYKYNGIDRKDNSKGYTKENTVPCCKTCNAMKNKLDKKQFLNQVKKIVKHSF